jgi:hypothetical protein
MQHKENKQETMSKCTTYSAYKQCIQTYGFANNKVKFSRANNERIEILK